MKVTCKTLNNKLKKENNNNQLYTTDFSDWA